MYHISDLRQYTNCPKLYFLNQTNKEDSSFEQYLRNEYSIVNLLKEYFGIEDCFEGEKNQNTQVFIDNKDKYDWFFNTRFDDEGMRIKVPVMHKVSDGFEIYFILYRTNNSEIDLFSFRCSVSVLRNMGIKIKKVYTISFNGEYIRHGELDVKKLFVLSDTINKGNLLKIIDEKQYDYKKVIKEIENYDTNNIQPSKNKACRLLGTCKYYDSCFKEEASLPDDNILTLVSSRYKNDMYDRGLIHLKDYDEECIEGNRVQYAQIMASKNGGLFVDKAALTNWLHTIKEEPISFIDFEWDRYLIPVYENMKPLDVVCFEFALYVLNKQGKLEHYTYIGKGDCRKEFVEELQRVLPKQGPILAYNALGAEMLRLEELKLSVPEYSDFLDNTISRFKDLATPFVEGMVYDTRMRGNFTVKKLLSVVSEFTYSNLEVGDGMNAVFAWRQIDKDIGDNQEEIINQLRMYCSLDSYSLFLIFKWLVECSVS